VKVCVQCGHRFTAGDWRCPDCGHVPSVNAGIPLLAPTLAAAGGGFEADYFAVLAGLEAKHFWFCNRNYLLNWAVKRYFPRATKMLEIGCGTGFVLASLSKNQPAMELAGSEIFLEGLTFARQRLPEVELMQMDALQIPFEAEFDLIGAFDVIEHIEADTEVLRQMHQAVPPGGGILLTVPQHPSLWSAFDEHSHHQRRYTRRELVGKVERAGFRVRRVTSFVFLLLPFMFATRRRKPANGNYDLFKDLRLNPVMGSLFRGVMAFESLLIRMGLSLPAGGSLLLVAEKI